MKMTCPRPYVIFPAPMSVTSLYSNWVTVGLVAQYLRNGDTESEHAFCEHLLAFAIPISEENVCTSFICDAHGFLGSGKSSVIVI